jgi:hypothetical protein
MTDISDVTATANEDATKLTKAELAELAGFAPQRLALVMTAGDFVSDVRLLPDSGGFATGNRTTFREHSFTTVLDDGFVVTTDAIVGRRGFMGSLASCGIYRLDPGFLMTSSASLAEIHALHVERVERFTKSRNSRVRAEHDRDLYFAFRARRSKQILRRAFIQFGLAIAFSCIAFWPSLKDVAWLGDRGPAVIGMLAAIVGFTLGTLIDIALRGNGPMLPRA